jgi:hypothetical protein
MAGIARIDNKFGLFGNAFDNEYSRGLGDFIKTNDVPNSGTISRGKSYLCSTYDTIIVKCLALKTINFECFDNWNILKQVLLYLYYGLIPDRKIPELQYIYVFIKIYSDDLTDIHKLELLISTVDNTNYKYNLHSLLCSQIYKYANVIKFDGNTTNYLYNQFINGNINALCGKDKYFDVSVDDFIEYFNNDGCYCNLFSINVSISLNLRSLECFLYTIKNRIKMCYGYCFVMSKVTYYCEIIKLWRAPKCIEYKIIIYRYLKQYIGTEYAFQLLPSDKMGNITSFIADVTKHINFAKQYIARYLKKPMKINNLIDIVVSYYD